MTDLLSTIASFVSALGPSGILESAIAMVVTALAPFVANVLHLTATDSRRAYIQDAIKNALAYGVSVVAKNPNTGDLLSVKDDVIAVAKAYLNELVPEGLAHLKISDAGLTQLLESGLSAGLDELSTLLGGLVARNKAVALAKAAH